MRKSLVLAAAAAAAALVCAPAALAETPHAQVTVHVGKLLEVKADDYGPSELADLQTELANTVAARAGKGGFTRVDLVLEDAIPNRPTFAMQGRYPQLSLRSLSLGGAKVTGVAYGPNGAQPIRFSYWSNDLRDELGAVTWTDASRAFDMLGGRLARGDAPNRFSPGELTSRPSGRFDAWR